MTASHRRGSIAAIVAVVGTGLVGLASLSGSEPGGSIAPIASTEPEDRAIRVRHTTTVTVGGAPAAANGPSAELVMEATGVIRLRPGVWSAHFGSVTVVGSAPAGLPVRRSLAGTHVAVRPSSGVSGFDVAGSSMGSDELAALQHALETSLGLAVAEESRTSRVPVQGGSLEWGVATMSGAGRVRETGPTSTGDSATGPCGSPVFRGRHVADVNAGEGARIVEWTVDAELDCGVVGSRTTVRESLILERLPSRESTLDSRGWPQAVEWRTPVAPRPMAVSRPTPPSHAELFGATGAESLRQVERMSRALREAPTLAGPLVQAALADPGHGRIQKAADVLMNAATPAAEAGLRQLVEQADARHADGLVQRASLLPSPTDETVDWLKERVASQVGTRSIEASAYALGAVASRRPDRSDLASALRELLSRDPEVGLVAIGNSGVAALFDAVVPFLRNPDARIRAAACLALRRMPQPQVNRLLIAGVLDVSGVVGMQALVALEGRVLSEVDQTFLARLFVLSHPAISLTSLFLQLLAAQPVLFAPVRPVLEVLDASPSIDMDARRTLARLRARFG